MSNITPEELNKRLSNGEDLIIWDVREEWEFNEYNIKGMLIPLHSIPETIDKLREFEEAEVIVHCKSGKRSSQAKKILTQHGFKNVRSLDGGIEAYSQFL